MAPIAWRWRLAFLLAAVCGVESVSAQKIDSCQLELDDAIVLASGGGRHACHLRSSGIVACWGANDAGQLGYDSDGESRAEPQDLGSVPVSKAVEAGKDHSCALTRDGGVFCWGANASGQLSWAPGPNAGPAQVTVPEMDGLALGGEHSCGWTPAGTVHCWGNNAHGQLGNGQATPSPSLPVTVSGLDDVVAMAAGQHHTCALEQGGELFCWGGNDSGQVGDGSTIDRHRPVWIGGGYSAVAAGGRHTCAIRGGQAECWGSNASGQLGLGNGAAAAVSRPTIVPGATDVAQIAVGGPSSGTCYRTISGALFCMGDNDSGQAGSEPSDQLASPTPVALGGPALMVAMADGTTYVLLVGELVAFGDDRFLQAVHYQRPPLCVAPESACGNDCVDTASDKQHCGGCFKRCDPGNCEDGICVAGPGQPGDACSAGTDCESGHCVEGACCETDCPTAAGNACVSCATGTCTRAPRFEECAASTGPLARGYCESDGSCASCQPASIPWGAAAAKPGPTYPIGVHREPPQDDCSRYRPHASITAKATWDGNPTQLSLPFEIDDCCAEDDKLWARIWIATTGQATNVRLNGTPVRETGNAAPITPATPFEVDVRESTAPGCPGRNEHFFAYSTSTTDPAKKQMNPVLKVGAGKPNILTVDLAYTPPTVIRRGEPRPPARDWWRMERPDGSRLIGDFDYVMFDYRVDLFCNNRRPSDKPSDECADPPCNGDGTRVRSVAQEPPCLTCEDLAKQGTVFVSTGEEVFSRTDLQVAGRGDLHFVFGRTYRSRLSYNGPLGHNWTHSYDVSVRTLPEGDVELLGADGRIDTFTAQAGGAFRSPEGMSVALRNLGGQYVLRDARNGLQTRFRADDGRLERMTDRYGHTMTFDYDQDRLISVVDAYGRTYTFTYSSHRIGGRRRLISVADFAGRTVRYEYDGYGDLVGVRSPAIVDTVTGNDFPDGRLERYTYSSGFSDLELNHNLLTFTAPHEVATGGPPMRRWTYGNDPADPLSFDRVVSEHRPGDAADPERNSIQYLATDQVRVTDAGGRARLHHLDQGGRTVRVEDLGETTPREVVTDRLSCGLVRQRTLPDGIRVVSTFDGSCDSTTGHQPRRTSARVVSRFCTDPAGCADDIVSTYTYEPVFGQIASVTTASGTTRYYYDYQEHRDPIAGIAEFGIADTGVLRGDDLVAVGGLDESYLVQDGTVDLNGDGNPAPQSFGALVLVTRTVTDADGAVSGLRTQIRYNDHGQVTAEIGEHGVTTQYVYYSDDDPDGDGTPVPGVIPSGASGYLYQTTVDGRTTTLERDALGFVTAVVNPRNVRSERQVNALGETTEVIRAAGVPGLSIRSRLHYDANGRVVWRQEDNGDGSVVGIGPWLDSVESYNPDGTLAARHSEVSSPYTPGSTTGLATSTWTYTEDRQIATRTSAAGRQVHYDYDASGRVVAVTQGYGTDDARTIRFGYDVAGRLEAVSDAEDTDGVGGPESTTTLYDGFSRPRTVVDAAGNIATFVYDLAGRRVEERWCGPATDEIGAPQVLLSVTRRDHDQLDRVIRSHQRIFEPAVEGLDCDAPIPAPELPPSATDEWLTTTRIFDGARLSQVISDEGAVWRYDYDPSGRLLGTTDPLGNRLVIEKWDANGNATVVRREQVDSATPQVIARQTRTTYVYDELDRLIRASDDAGQTTYLTYNRLGQLIRRADPEGAQISDPLQRVPGSINAPGNTVRREYDGLSRIVREVRDRREGGAIVLRYGYDLDGLVTELVDDAGNPTRLSYDALGRRTRYRTAGGGEAVLTYDQDDNLRTVTDFEGNLLSYSYDALDRLRRFEVTPNGSDAVRHTQTFGYDGMSRLVSATDNNDGRVGAMSTLTRAYDSLSRLLRETQNGVDVTSTFAADGARLSLRYPGGRTVSWHDHDALNRPTHVADANGTLATHHWLGGGGVQLTRTHGNGTQRSLLDGAGMLDGLDAAGRLARLRVNNPAGDSVIDRELTYNRTGRLLSERRHADGGRTDVFTYDSLYRLTDVSYGTDSGAAVPLSYSEEHFTFDGVGNRTGRQTVSGDVAASWLYGAANPLNQIPDVTIPATAAGSLIPGPATLTHDQNGNLTSDPSRGLIYSWNALGRLTTVRDAAGTLVAEYDYDALGRRIRRATGGGETRFYYDGARVVEERDESGATAATYVWGQSYVDELVQLEIAGQPFYAHQDARYSVVAMTDSTGAVAERAHYTSFGETTYPGGGLVSEVGNPYGFQGRRLDEETGLYYYRARYYDPVQGRFLSRDPAWDPVNVGNLYAFVGNDPLGGLDPSGLQTDGDFDRLFTRPPPDAYSKQKLVPWAYDSAYLRFDEILAHIQKATDKSPTGSVSDLRGMIQRLATRLRGLDRIKIFEGMFMECHETAFFNRWGRLHGIQFDVIGYVDHDSSVHGPGGRGGVSYLRSALDKTRGFFVDPATGDIFSEKRLRQLRRLGTGGAVVAAVVLGPSLIGSEGGSARATELVGNIVGPESMAYSRTPGATGAGLASTIALDTIDIVVDVPVVDEIRDLVDLHTDRISGWRYLWRYQKKMMYMLGFTAPIGFLMSVGETVYDLNQACEEIRIEKKVHEELQELRVVGARSVN